MARLRAALAPHATAVRVAGGLLTIVGTLLPWATFVLNSGPYPDKATLQYFVAPFAVTGFRLHLLLFGIATLVLTFAPMPARGRILRGFAWGIIGIAVINGLYITVEGGGLGAITVADGAVAFGAVVTLLGGVLVELGARAGGVEPRPVWTWRFRPWVERVVLVVVYVVAVARGGCDAHERRHRRRGEPVRGCGLPVLPRGAGRCLRGLARLRPDDLGGDRRRAAPGRSASVALLVVALALPLTSAGSEYWMTVAANIGVYAATAIGLNIVVGLAGLLDLGYVAFLGIGAFVAANLSGAAAAKFDVHAAVRDRHGDLRGGRGDVRRHRGLTDTAGARRLPRDRHAGLRRDLRAHRAEQHRRACTGGSNAIPNIPQVVLFDVRFSDRISGRRPPAPCGRPVLRADRACSSHLSCWCSATSSISRLGRAWIAIREDEDAARAMGIRTGPIKILAFLIGATIAGFAGAFFAHKTGTVSYESFRFLESVTLLAAVILGGMGTVPGAVLGASVLFVLPEKLREFSEYRLLLFGIALIVIMRFRPQGLIPDRHRRAELAHDPADEPPPGGIAGGTAGTRAEVPA